jgi:thiamine-monophosphate kinase
MLCVTGTLGGGWNPEGTGRHLSDTPRVAEARALVEALGDRLHAMIDISDGLGRDAGHLAAESGLAAEIDAERLPLAPGADWRAGIGRGEDYELAFACEGAPPGALCGTPVTVVGQFVAGAAGRVLVRLEGAEHDASSLGWEHGS